MLRRCLRLVAHVVTVFSTISCQLDKPAAPATVLMPYAQSGSVAVALSLVDVDSLPTDYYFRQPRAVTPDPSVFMIATPAGVGIQRVRDALSANGVTLATIKPFPQLPFHYEVTFPRGNGASLSRERARAIRSAVSIAFAEPRYRIPGTDHWKLLVNRLVVQFRSGTASSKIESFARDLGLSLERGPKPEFGSFDYWYRMPPGPSNRALAFLKVALDDPSVDWAIVDNIVSGAGPTSVPADPLYPLQFHLNSNWVNGNGVPVDVNVEPAWDITRGAGIKIAVIGDGVDWLHSDIGGWSGSMMLDVVNLNGPVCQGNSFAPEGNDGHETAVAGIIFSKHNAIGGAGIAPDATMNVVRWFCGEAPPGPLRHATEAELAYGINWAWQYAGSDVLSNSWRWPATFGGGTAITNAINQATTLGRNGRGAVVVFAAGNSAGGPVQFPGGLPNVLTVSALNPEGYWAIYAAVGPEIDVVAPSGYWTDYCVGDVITTDRAGAPGCNNGPGGSLDYRVFSGTSAAAPQAAAVAALVLAEEPGLSEATVRARLCASADPWGPANQFGCGKVNAFRALTGWPLSVSISGPSKVRPGVGCRWTASPSGGLGAYSYVWRVDGNVEGTNSPAFYFENYGLSFSLSVTVSDQFNPPHSETVARSVAVAANAPSCPM